jgi:3-hydroxyacyl-[acyl-carrier-protein] dehydratase
MLTIDQILEILPHRYPFLMVDGVTEVGPERICAFKNISFNEPQFQGHFPGLPVMPGVLIVEAMAQSGAILAHQDHAFDPATQILFFMTIDKAKFRSQVKPGDRLELEVVPVRKGSSVWKMKGTARVGDKVVASAEFMAAITDRAPAEEEKA